jgi:hypothetical protein
MSKAKYGLPLALTLLATGCAQPPAPPSYQPPATPVAQQIKIEGAASALSPDTRLNAIAAIAQIHAIDGATIDHPAEPGDPIYMTPGRHHLDVQVSFGGHAWNDAPIDFDFKEGTAYVLQLSAPVLLHFNCVQTTLWMEDWQGHDLTAKIPVLMQGSTDEPGFGPAMSLFGNAMYHFLGQNCPGTSILPQHPYQWQG